jgi:cytidine deaminase
MNNFTYKSVNRRKIFEIDDSICSTVLQKVNGLLKNCYPDAGKGYAAVVLTEKGNMYEGVSYNSDTYTLTMHSEATALAHAAIHGEKNIVAITGPNCHICKQLIWESSLNSGIDVLVILSDKGKIKKIPISRLMPYPWPEKK